MYNQREYSGSDYSGSGRYDRDAEAEEVKKSGFAPLTGPYAGCGQRQTQAPPRTEAEEMPINEKI
jgi:hypothetical protein